MFTKVSNLRDHKEYFAYNNKFMKCEACTVDVTEGLFLRKTKSYDLFKNWADVWRYSTDGEEVPEEICTQLRKLFAMNHAKEVLDEYRKSQ